MTRAELLTAYLAACAAYQPYYRRWKAGERFTITDEDTRLTLYARKRLAWAAWIATEEPE